MKKVKILGLLVLLLAVVATISYAAESKNILQAIEGTYAVDYQVRGEYLNFLKKIYGDKVVIESGHLNGWRLNIEDIIKVSDTEYIVTCGYLLKGTSYPPPGVEAKLFVYLSSGGKAQKIEHKTFHSSKWPDGEWKTDMIFYRQ